MTELGVTGGISMLLWLLSSALLVEGVIGRTEEGVGDRLGGAATLAEFLYASAIAAAAWFICMIL